MVCLKGKNEDDSVAVGGFPLQKVEVVIFTFLAYNKNVIINHIKHDKNVRKCIYGTIAFEETVRLEGFALP